MRRLAFDRDRCLACRSCEIACAVVHSQSGLARAGPRRGRPSRAGASRSPAARTASTALRCEQCDEPLCVYACKSGALARDPADRPRVARRGALPRLRDVPDGLPLRHPPRPGARPRGALRRLRRAATSPACVAACPTARARRARRRSDGARARATSTGTPGRRRVVGRRHRRLRGGPGARARLHDHARDGRRRAAVLAAAARPTRSPAASSAAPSTGGPPSYLEAALGVEVLRGARAIGAPTGHAARSCSRTGAEIALRRARHRDRRARQGAVRSPAPTCRASSRCATLEDLDAIAGARRSRAAARVVLGGGNVGLQACEALLERGLARHRRRPLVAPALADGRRRGRPPRRRSCSRAHGVALRTGRDVVEIVGDGQRRARCGSTTARCCRRISWSSARGSRRTSSGSPAAASRSAAASSSTAPAAPACPASSPPATAPRRVDPLSGDSAVSGIWPVAYEMGRAAGSTAVGVERPSAGALRLNASRFFGAVDRLDRRGARRTGCRRRAPRCSERREATSTASSSTATTAWSGALLYGDISQAGAVLSSLPGVAAGQRLGVTERMSRIIAPPAADSRWRHACVDAAHSGVDADSDGGHRGRRHGREAPPSASPDTAYALPVILALTGRRVEKLGDLEEALADRARLAARDPDRAASGCPTSATRSTPARATLIAHEAMEALKPLRGIPLVEGFWLGPTSDAHPARAGHQARRRPHARLRRLRGRAARRRDRRAARARSAGAQHPRLHGLATRTARRWPRSSTAAASR